MNILVCMKQVLDDSVEIGYDESKGKFTPDGVPNVENAFDTYALEMATRLKEKVGGEITLVSIGSDAAKDALKNGLAVGGDNATLVKGDNYQDVDSYVIAQSFFPENFFICFKRFCDYIKDLHARIEGA